MDTASPYYRCHLIVAAIRVLDHKNGSPPVAEDLAAELSYSAEEVHSLVNQLEKAGVVQVVESAAKSRLFVADPAPLEDLPREKKADVAREMEAFAAKRKEEMDRIAQHAGEEKERKKSLFAELEAQLKSQVKKSRE